MEGWLQDRREKTAPTTADSACSSRLLRGTSWTRPRWWAGASGTGRGPEILPTAGTGPSHQQPGTGATFWRAVISNVTHVGTKLVTLPPPLPASPHASLFVAATQQGQGRVCLPVSLLL